MKNKNTKKAADLMIKLLSIYVEDHEPITIDYRCLGMHYKLTFDAENLNNTEQI